MVKLSNKGAADGTVKSLNVMKRTKEEGLKNRSET
jgi:hypothetical protein